jgi:ribosome-associated heat shock protein Hsp15
MTRTGRDASDDDDDSPPGGQRLDKWLWFARIVKSRTLAAKLVSDGKIRVNRLRTDKPSHVVKPGDVLTATVHRSVRVLKITAIGERRGPATEAQALYADLTAPAKGSANNDTSPAVSPETNGGAALHTRGQPRPVEGSGRPTKRDRRRFDDWRRG